MALGRARYLFDDAEDHREIALAGRIIDKHLARLGEPSWISREHPISGLFDRVVKVRFRVSVRSSSP